MRHGYFLSNVQIRCPAWLFMDGIGNVVTPASFPHNVPSETRFRGAPFGKPCTVAFLYASQRTGSSMADLPCWITQGCTRGRWKHLVCKNPREVTGPTHSHPQQNFCTWLQDTRPPSLWDCASPFPSEPLPQLCAHLLALEMGTAAMFPVVLIQAEWNADQGAERSLFTLFPEIQGIKQEMKSIPPSDQELKLIWGCGIQTTFRN